MDLIVFFKWLHVLGACVLIGTGAGIAFFMLMAHRTRDAKLIAHTASVVVVADLIFTASAVVIQPLTGAILIYLIGWSFFDFWVIASLTLYVLIGVCWLPVVWIQAKMRDIAVAASAENLPLPDRYFQLYKRWFVLGIPAFVFILAIVWLMLAKPVL